MHSPLGSFSIKERHGLVLKISQGRAEVLWGTAFENKEEPPRDPKLRKQYFCIAHKDKENPGRKAKKVPVIKYTGSDFLKKDTFMQFTKPNWVELEFSPLS